MDIFQYKAKLGELACLDTDNSKSEFLNDLLWRYHQRYDSLTYKLIRQSIKSLNSYNTIKLPTAAPLHAKLLVLKNKFKGT